MHDVLVSCFFPTFFSSYEQTTFHDDDLNTNFLFDFANSDLGVLPHFC